MTTDPTTSSSSISPVIVDFQDISKSPDETNNLAAQLESAIGGGSVGIIAIRNVPGFVEAKNAFLPMAHTLAHLEPEYLKSLEDPTSFYNAGWSHGKEKLGDEPDFAKA